MRLIAVISQNGSVGKTTLTANLGHVLALMGNKVILIDFDPRGQLSAHLGLFRTPSRGVDGILLDAADLASVSLNARDGMQLVPAGSGLDRVERTGRGGLQRARLLQMGLQRRPPQADFVLIDCPTTCEMLTANALMAADETLIPVTEDCLSGGGPAQFLQTIGRFEKLRGRTFCHWLSLSRSSSRRQRSAALAEKIANNYQGCRLGAPIPEAAVLAECPDMGRTVFEYRSKSRSAMAFRRLAENLLGDCT